MSHSPDVAVASPKLTPQSTSSTQQSLVQVPADLLQNLTAKVAQLERCQEILIAAFEDELAQLQTSAGDSFSRFSKVPKELQDMIWDFALKAPQIHIMRGEDISRSKVNDVMQACSGARTRGLMLKMPYYQVGKARNPHHMMSPYEFLPAAPRFYMNFDVDTLWVGQHGRFLPNCVRYVCNFCEHEIGYQSVHQFSFPSPSTDVPACQHKIILKRLAFHYDMWKYFQDTGVHTESTFGQ
jgi:hypothetical protein